VASSESVRRAFTSLASGDPDGLLVHLAEGAVWRVNGAGPFAGDHHGADGIRRLFAARSARSDEGSYRLETTDVLGEGDHVVVLHITRARRAGSLQSLGVTVIHERDGAISEAWEYAFDQHGADEFWA
jgi:ketosteroid isomerase-like protein